MIKIPDIAFEPLILELMTNNPAIAACAVIEISNGTILFQTDNWEIGNDIKSVFKAWKAGADSIKIQDVNYVTIQVTQESLISSKV